MFWLLSIAIFGEHHYILKYMYSIHITLSIVNANLYSTYQIPLQQKLHCGSNNNPTVGQFVDALKTSIINGLAYTGLRNANCEGDDTVAIHAFKAWSDEKFCKGHEPRRSCLYLLTGKVPQTK